MTVGARLKQHWLQQNIFAVHPSWNAQTIRKCQSIEEKALRGASASDIANFEERYDVHLPEDLRQYFSTVNGMGSARSETMDNSLLCLWSIDEMKSVAEFYVNVPQLEELDPASLFIFADYCIECQYYVIQLHSDSQQPTPVYWMADTPRYQFGNSFTDFIEFYMTDADFIVNPWRE